MAPEMLDPRNGYNPEQTDVFSLGVILFSMYLGKPPFRQANSKKDDLYKMICEQKYK
jgi:serine/threonine protein kinase